MRKRIVYYLSILLAFTVAACVSAKKVTLDGYIDEENKVEALSSKDIIPAMSKKLDYLNGWVAKKPSEIDVKESSDQLVLDVVGKKVKKSIVYKNIEGLDFRGDIGLKVSAKAEGNVNPSLQLEMVDYTGKVTNAKLMTIKVDRSEYFTDYFFNLNGAFWQSFPEFTAVNGAMIKEVRLIVNPRRNKFQGKVIIDEMEIVFGESIYRPKSSVAVGKPSGDISLVTAANNMDAENGYEARLLEGNLEIICDNVGPGYQDIEVEIDPLNFQIGKTLAVKAEVTEGNMDPFLRIDLIDPNKFVTNWIPVTQQLAIGKEDTYSFNYEGRLKQSYPKKVSLDGKRIIKLRIYVNPGYNPFSGKIILKSMTLK
jgi:hypothetical protein